MHKTLLSSAARAAAGQILEHPITTRSKEIRRQRRCVPPAPASGRWAHPMAVRAAHRRGVSCHRDAVHCHGLWQSLRRETLAAFPPLAFAGRHMTRIGNSALGRSAHVIGAPGIGRRCATPTRARCRRCWRAPRSLRASFRQGSCGPSRRRCSRLQAARWSGRPRSVSGPEGNSGSW
jgi:hypothetical protein